MALLKSKYEEQTSAIDRRACCAYFTGPFRNAVKHGELGDVSSQLACTVAGLTPTGTCGIQCWGKCWNALCAPAGMVCRTANASRAPTSILASTLRRLRASAARHVQVMYCC